jgi:hypothetical protein
MNATNSNTAVDTNTYVWASNGLPYDGNKANIQAYLADGLINVIKGLVIRIDSSTVKACIMFYSLEIGSSSQMSLTCSQVFSCERQASEYLQGWFNIDANHITYKSLGQILDSSSLVCSYTF